jgi:glycerophosphoryl diester phosphodiesterase
VSFRKAIELRANMTELDIHVSKDGELVVMHDPMVDRTTNGSGLIKDYTLAEIKKLDAGSWYGPEFTGEKVPTLQEVMDVVKGKIKLNIEIKGNGEELYPGIIDMLIEHIYRNDMVDSVVVSTFHRQYLYEVIRKAPEVQVALLYSKETTDPIQDALDQHWNLHPNQKLVSTEFVDKAHSHGLLVRAWNPNAKEAMHTLVRMGVDGIGTDYPEILLQVLKEEGR